MKKNPPPKGYKSNRCPQCNCRGQNHKADCLFVIGRTGVDFLECLVCGHKARSLKQHIGKSHGLSPKEYQGELLAPASKSAYSRGSSGRDNWVKRLKNTDPQLASLKIAAMAQSVSKTVLENPEEITRRAKGMQMLWQKHRTYLCRVASETAKVTSSRQDILEKRTLALRNWRDKDPQLFYEQCISKMIKMRSSKPEKELLLWCQQTHPELEFKGSQSLFRVRFSTKSNRRQIDIFSRKAGVVIEFDGPIHFTNIPSWNQLEKVQDRDKEVDEVLGKEYAMVRVSFDQWKRNHGFAQDCLTLLKMILEEPNVYTGKVTKIGSNYGPVCGG